MGYANSKNLWLALLAIATVALSIALGVTLARDNGSKSSSSSNNNNGSNNQSTGSEGGPPSDPGRPGFGGADDTRVTPQIAIDLSGDILSCPLQEGSSQPFVVTDLANSAAVEISLSSEGMLCTLVRISNPSGDGARENTFLQPIGRSYSNHPWEVTRGKFISETDFTCGELTCTIDLNKIEAVEGGGSYQLTTFYDPAQYTKKDVVARFLEQATFGGSQAEINALDALEAGSRDDLKQSATLGRWVQDQQDITKTPIMSHRAIYREHLNARFEVPNPLGRQSLPCEAGARYRRMTFTEKDVGKKLTLTTDGTSKLFSVDGKVRTSFVPPLFYADNEAVTELWWPDEDYRICKVAYDKYEGLATVEVKHPDFSKCIELAVQAQDGFYYSNPPIQIHAGANDVMLTIPTASAQLIDTEYAAKQEALTAGFVNSPENQEIIVNTDLTDAVCADLHANGGAEKAVIAEWNGNHYIFDPRHHILENSLSTPLPDGGGAVAKQFGSALGQNFSPMCANAARTFVNEDTCFLSNDPNVCSSRPTKKDSRAVSADLLGETSEFRMTLDLIPAVYEATGAGAEGTVYLYAIDGLDINRDPTATPPCQRIDNSGSRWVIEPCSDNPGEGLGSKTTAFFEKFLGRAQAKNDNPYFLDWWVPKRQIGSCDPADELKVGFEIRNTNEEGTCFRNVHIDHLNVYDFTYWVESHPGNSETRNPISEFAVNGEAKLKFPDWHEMDRWQQQKARLKPQRLRAGTIFDFYKLPANLRTEELARGLGVGLQNQAVEETDEALGPIMVCGSPYEVANNPFDGGNIERGAFDAVTQEYKTTTRAWLNAQKGFSWLIAAMEDEGQLRQRAAWALSQIFAINKLAIRGGQDTTECFTTYFDIFVRNAFKTYRDVLKEVSYSPMMAEMLTYYGGRSTAIVLEDEGNFEYADENYAREIMQLFTMGLYVLNQDGTQQLDEQGTAQRVYTNDDIEEYARAWTGFIRQPRRGNFEERYNLNQIDPMQIFAAWRDRFPKMGLNRKYVGDQYPLCSDLPPQHFLSQGSTYRLLDSPAPELHVDPIEWRSGGEAPLVLDAGSNLYTKLAGEAPKLKVVLDQALSCTGDECSINTVRTVKVGENYYEYIRAPCVNQAFYSDAKTIAKRTNGGHAMCGDPRVESATAACCGASEGWSEKFWGERMSFDTASDRCSASLCGLDKQPACSGNQCLSNNYYWTSSPCTLKAKIDTGNGKVGIVHGPSGVADDAVASIVQPHQKTLFRVDWEGDFAQVLASCESLGSCSLTEDKMCLCDVSVTDEPVFSGSSAPSRQAILGSLSIGAVDPDPLAALQGEEVSIFNAGADGTLTADSAFAVLDDFGRRVVLKNAKSTVNVVTGLSFRNPVHFLSMVDAEPRDAHQETDATLDHYFYHRNTAPFVAYRFAQRFGISNPSPRYTEEISKAFRTGTYTSDSGVNFGSGTYGDMASTFAAVLLDREARDFVLDTDPSHGSLKEPLLKIVGLMRALNFKTNDIFKWVEFGFNFGESIGQMAHEIPNVFSFFLPEYQPSGAVSQGALVAPEAQVMTGPRIVDTMNGIFSMLKYGLHFCLDGFGPWGFGKYCKEASIGKKLGVGGMYYNQPDSAETAVDELATLLTSGRLSQETRSLVRDVFTDNQDENAAIRAQMLISATPEYHATGIVQPTGENRPERPAPTFSEEPYKAVVYIQLAGGYDSFNTLVPQTCAATNGAGRTLVEQYEYERTTVALSEEERSKRVIDATGQACEQFAVHPEMEFLERLYNEGDLAFVANAGQLDAPVTKNDYYLKSQSQLFAHNTMQTAGQRLDPWNTAPGTGILGRMCDVLKVKGYNAQPITVQVNTVATVGVPGASKEPLTVALKGPSEFGRSKRSDKLDMNDYVGVLNNATELHSSVFGETWSTNFQRAVEDSALLTEALDRIELTQEYVEDDDIGEDYSRTAKAVASLLLTHQDRGTDRDVMFATIGGWDTHANVKEELSYKFAGLNKAFSGLESELKAQGLWDQVTVIVTSDFGRTLTANSGEGSDHAWGGHYFMFGGSVKGGQILGDYPPDISAEGPVNIGRGRIIPTSSWESMFTGPLQWMGLDTEDDLDYCMPNRLNTGAPLFTADQVFKQSRRSLRRSEN